MSVRFGPSPVPLRLTRFLQFLVIVKFSIVRFAVVGLNTFSEGVVLCYFFNTTFRLIPKSNVENSIQT